MNERDVKFGPPCPCAAKHPALCACPPTCACKLNQCKNKTVWIVHNNVQYRGTGEAVRFFLRLTQNSVPTPTKLDVNSPSLCSCHSPDEVCLCQPFCGCRTTVCKDKPLVNTYEPYGSGTIPGPSLKIRAFPSGAFRDTDEGKPDYFGFISARVTKRFGEYMEKHRTQRDGSRRAADNWKKGLDRVETLKSLVRHVEDLKLIYEGYPEEAREDEENALCAILFNAQSLLYERLKLKTQGEPDAP